MNNCLIKKPYITVRLFYVKFSEKLSNQFQFDIGLLVLECFVFFEEKPSAYRIFALRIT